MAEKKIKEKRGGNEAAARREANERIKTRKGSMEAAGAGG